MSSNTRRVVRVAGIAVTAAALGTAGIAFADNVNPDGDTVAAANSASFSGGCSTRTLSGDVVVNYNSSSNHFAPGSAAVSYSSTDGAVTVGGPASVTVPASYDANGDKFSFALTTTLAAGATGTGSATGTVTVTQGALSRSGSYSVSWNCPVPPPSAPDADGDEVPDASDNCVNVANPDQSDIDGDTLGDACDANSHAPVVGVQAGDANGNEGTAGNPQTSGSFTDLDGNGWLTVTKVSGEGAVVDNGDGTFSWSHTTTDDATGTVTVKASDGEHADATQTFAWNAANVDPAVGTIGLARTGACAVSLSAVFSDAGTADTHNAVIDWGDGTTSNPAGDEVSPAVGTHTYGAAGSYVASVTVTDDDGGSDAANAAAFKANNTPSAILQPINNGGTRSGFKLGSTIPVKITVTGCGGAAVNSLTPQVNLEQGDTSPDVAVNEAAVSEVPTNGKLMRWDATAQQYIYNLSSKLSQFTGGPLPQGTYTVSVNDPSFAGPVKAVFDLRK